MCRLLAKRRHLPRRWLLLRPSVDAAGRLASPAAVVGEGLQGRWRRPAPLCLPQRRWRDDPHDGGDGGESLSRQCRCCWPRARCHRQYRVGRSGGPQKGCRCRRRRPAAPACAGPTGSAQRPQWRGVYRQQQPPLPLMQKDWTHCRHLFSDDEVVACSSYCSCGGSAACGMRRERTIKSSMGNCGAQPMAMEDEAKIGRRSRSHRGMWHPSGAKERSRYCGRCGFESGR